MYEHIARCVASVNVCIALSYRDVYVVSGVNTILIVIGTGISQ
jgi:hypothetical protein